MAPSGTLILLLVLAAACREAPPPPSGTPPGGPARLELSGSGVGCLAIGVPLANLAAGCRIVADRVVPGPEGTQERRADIVVGADTVTATIVGDSVWRAEVTAPGLRTSDSIGVGTTAAALLARSGSRVVGGEGRLFITLSDHCGMSFELGQVPREALALPPDRAAERIPGEAPVTRVLVFGCEAAR